jgi:hypothetical protein
MRCTADCKTDEGLDQYEYRMHLRRCLGVALTSRMPTLIHYNAAGYVSLSAFPISVLANRSMSSKVFAATSDVVHCNSG